MLPKTLKYGSKIESAYARSSRVNIQPQSGTGTYVAGDTIIINIPTRSNLVLVASESYLKFNVNITNNSTSDNAFRWGGCGANSIISRLRVFAGSNLLEDIDNYNMLANMLYDIQMPTDSTYGKFNVLSGTRSDLVTRASAPAACTVAAANDATAGGINAVIAAAVANNLSVSQINSGDRVEGNGALVATTAVISATYCLSLISLVGLLSSQNYIPLFEMTSAPLRVEIQLVPALVNALNYLTLTGGTPTFTITNCEYVANFIELGDPAIAMIKDSLGGQPLQFVFPSYRNYAYTYPLANGSTASIAMPIAAKFSSVKALFVTMRDRGTGAVSYFPCSSVTRGILDYQFRVGAQVMPPKVPSTLPEMFAEVCKAIASISDLNHQPSIDKASYSLAISANTAASLDTATSVSNQQSGSFYIGLDLETYSNAPKDSIFTGYNTNTDDIYCLINLGTQTAAATLRLDAYCNFDAVFICENNTAYIRF